MNANTVYVGGCDMPNQVKFRNVLAKHYAELFATSEEYVYAAARNTPEGLATKMTVKLAVGGANKDGEGIRRTCAELGIKHTYKAISAFLAVGPGVMSGVDPAEALSAQFAGVFK